MPPVKVGDKVTIKYDMKATAIEVKGSDKKEEKKADKKDDKKDDKKADKKDDKKKK